MKKKLLVATVGPAAAVLAAGVMWTLAAGSTPQSVLPSGPAPAVWRATLRVMFTSPTITSIRW